MNFILMKRNLLILFLLAFSVCLSAQRYCMEAGAWGGASFYMGDANNNKLFYNMEPAYGLLVRYNINGRFSLRTDFSSAGISGRIDAGDEDKYLSGKSLTFDNRIYNLGFHFEFNFFEYGVPSYYQESRSVSPYVSAGFGIMGYDAESFEIGYNIPLSLGIKAKVFRRINIGCEWQFNMSFSDDMDYSDYGGDFQLEEPALYKSSSVKNNDWYSVLMFYISYDIFNTKPKCYR